MTNPLLDPLPQIAWFGEHGFEFVDLAIEPPKADVPQLEPLALREALNRKNLGVVVHTSPFLPFGHPSRAVQDAVLSELLDALDVARALRAPLFTLHYTGAPPYYSHDERVAWYVNLLTHLLSAADGSGVQIALENSPENRDELRVLRDVFKRLPALRLLLDLAHANVKTPANLTDDFLRDVDLGGRLAHVHVSDNNGQGDQHLPLGGVSAGMDWPKLVGLLRRFGYEGTITLEVHSPDRDYLLLSRDKFKAWWEAAR